MTPQQESPGADWRQQRAKGITVIAASSVIAAAIWFAIRYLAPAVPHMDAVGDRLIFAFQLWCIAVLFCFATGIDAVAHERLQSAAFDPLIGHETKRMRVNLRYLQNTLEQLVLFTAGLFGLAYYCADGEAMRAVEATAAVWILFRFAFWIGYHYSATLRALGAAGVALSLILLVYVVSRIALDLWGTAGLTIALVAFFAIEAYLFWVTRARPEGGS